MRSCGSAMSGTLETAVAETGKLYVSLLARPRRDGVGTWVVGTTTLVGVNGVAVVLVLERFAI
jgi:hypothetical protein